MPGIYIIKNKANSDIYIGSAINVNARWRKHKSLLNKNTHYNNRLQNSWNKYTDINFEFILLEECEEFILIEREQFYIDLLKPAFNYRKIAQSNFGLKSSVETREKISAGLKLYYNNNPEICLQISNKMKGNKINCDRPSKKKGVPANKDSVNKMKLSKSTKNIIQLDLNYKFIKEWPSILELCNTLDISNGNVLRCCKNERRTYKKFIWQYKN